MNEGVKILLERMKTNPDEFEGIALSTKWGQLIRLYEDYLEPEDQKALSAGVNKIQQQAFTQQVMKELLAPEEDDDMGKYFRANVTSATHSAGAIPEIPSISLTSRKTQINAMKVQVRKKATLKKEHETLYGKLKNYLHSDT